MVKGVRLKFSCASFVGSNPTFSNIFRAERPRAASTKICPAVVARACLFGGAPLLGRLGSHGCFGNRRPLLLQFCEKKGRGGGCGGAVKFASMKRRALGNLLFFARVGMPLHFFFGTGTLRCSHGPGLKGAVLSRMCSLLVWQMPLMVTESRGYYKTIKEQQHLNNKMRMVR